MSDATPPETAVRERGRNDPCHCGSGKKYKRCCLSRDAEAEREARAEQAPVEPEAPSQGKPPPPKGRRRETDQPWKRGAQRALGARKPTTHRKVGS